MFVFGGDLMWDTSDLNLSSLISLTPVPSDGAIVSAMRIGLILLRDEDGNVHFAPNGSITSVV